MNINAGAFLESEGRINLNGVIYSYTDKDKVLIGNYQRFVGWQILAVNDRLETRLFMLLADGSIR